MLIIKMGGMLDCSAGMEDEIDVFPTCRRWWVSGEGEEGGFSYRRDH